MKDAVAMGAFPVGDRQARQRGRHSRIDREDRKDSASVDGHRADAKVVGDRHVCADGQARCIRLVGQVDGSNRGVKVDRVAGLCVGQREAQRLRVGGGITIVQDGEGRGCQPVLQPFDVGPENAAAPGGTLAGVNTVTVAGTLQPSEQKHGTPRWLKKKNGCRSGGAHGTCSVAARTFHAQGGCGRTGGGRWLTGWRSFGKSKLGRSREQRDRRLTAAPRTAAPPEPAEGKEDESWTSSLSGGR